MQIVIDVPEEMYQSVLNGTYCGTLYEELKTGTPLPKGHGRLIDADELYNSLKFPTQQFALTFKQVLDDAPTIIEADDDELYDIFSKIIDDMYNELPSVTPQPKTGQLTNSKWIDFLSEQFNISRTSAKEMLHVMMSVKKEDNFKKQFSGRK